MRIVSYNILLGGEGRADPLAEVIEAQRPDVVALVEAIDLDVVNRIAKRLGMDYVHAAGNSLASVLMSRWPIRDSINHAPQHPELSKSLLEATVVVPAAGEWSFGVVHLHHHATEQDEDRRGRELEVLLGLFSEHRTHRRPHVLCGDFNANSPHQKIGIERCKSSTREAYESNGGKIPRRVIQRLFDEGYVDTLRAARGDAADSMASFTTRSPGQRVDYVFVHGVEANRVTSAWVEQDRLAKYASDHFPVGAEIAVSS